jgi:3-oxoadipate enol-lactonase
MDMPGQGESYVPECPVDLDLQRRCFLEVVNELKVTRWNLIGLSNGGRLALSIAETHSKETELVVAADCYDGVSELMKLKLSSWLSANDIGGPEHRFDVATPWIWGESVLQESPQLVEYYRSKAHQHNPKSIKNLIKGAMSGEVDLLQVTCPTLLLAGEEDVLTPPYIHRQMMNKLASGTFKLVPGGHASLLEVPITFQSIILPWLKNELMKLHRSHEFSAGEFS